MRHKWIKTLALLGSAVQFLPAQDRTVGLISHDATRSSPGYTLLAPKHYKRTYLIDNYGQVINTWDSKYEPGQSAHLLPNGHLLRAAMIQVPGGGTGGGEGGRIEEYDWQGNLVWEFDYATQAYALHHDIKPLPNGNVIALMVERKTREEAIAAGFKPDLLRDSYMLPDAVVEVEPVRPKGGRIVWEWHVWDHLIQNADPTKSNYGTPSAHPELVDPNASGRSIPAFWNHMNSIDYNPALDQIILSVRGNSEAWVIDHSTTNIEAASHSGGKYGKGGDLLYRWGNPRMYGRGATADQMLFDQHDVQWIEKGRPGAGNLLVFNNGIGRPGGQASSADEWLPPVDSSGQYTIAAGSAYGPKELAWTFTGTLGTQYYAEAISGAYRLPNGNTLICYGTRGVLAEVTQGKEVVWQYVNPVVKEGPLSQGQTSGVDDRGHNWNAVFKVRRYAPDYPGLAEKDLTPRGLIERFAVSYVNAASFQTGPTAPGAILSAFGENLAASEQAAASAALPTKLAGTSVEVADSSGTTQAGQLFFASPRQINLVTPSGSAQGLATFTIRRDSVASTWASVAVEAVAPGLFTMNASGEGVGAVLGLRVLAAGGSAEVPAFSYDQASGKFVTVPVDLGAEGDQVHLSLYGTGIRGRSSLAAVSATIGGMPVPVSYAGAQSQYPGLDQVNVGPLPRSLAGKGEADLVLKVDGRTANTVKVSIR